ncbi:MAG: GNAT family N-acetyltransferase [Lachnospiraceae bacterium]|nr:GNAT family N-acetyltransferase [Lachnospiraceae bacterium]
MNTNDYTIRLERSEDFREVENLVRESFWNVYRPGCSEHFVIHVLRNDPAFVKELDFVMEQGGMLIGQNMFMRTVINADDGRVIPVLTMGPIGITPKLKRRGYGKKLLDYSLEKAADMGFGAVLFEGNIGFYGHSGFSYAREFGIRYHDLPEGADDSFFLCKELISGYLDDVTGVYQTPQGYYVNDADVEEFDKAFPPKEKLRLPGQITIAPRSYRDEDYEAVCDFLIELNRKDGMHINWNWARFEWMMEHPEFDRDARNSIGLWWSGDGIIGAAIYDMYFGEAFCGALPEYEELYPEILGYAYRELKDDSGLAIAINRENTAEIRAAELAGFWQTDQKETIMALSLDRDFSSLLPKGLQLREMDQIADREALEWLFWQGFDHGDDREAFERSLDHIPHVRRHFNKSLSLSAADPSGEAVSHCSLWFHPDTDYAYVEPVCTIPAYRGKGISSALLSEAFSRAKALGAKMAYVISDLPFYEKLGFETVQHYSFYRKV